MNEEQIEKAKVAVVTGAGRGIGRAIAESLAKQEMKVICVSKTEGSCGAAAEAIREAGGDAFALPVDVSSGAEITKACEELLEEHECVDVLVNNAGITRDNLLFRMDEADWQHQIGSNLGAWQKAGNTTNFSILWLPHQKTQESVNRRTFASQATPRAIPRTRKERN